MSFEGFIPPWLGHPERMLSPGRNEVFRILLNPSLNSGTTLLASDGTGFVAGDPVVRIPGSQYDACDMISRVRHNSNRLILNFTAVNGGDCAVRDWWPEVWARSELFLASKFQTIDCAETPAFASVDDAGVQSTYAGSQFLEFNMVPAHPADVLLDDVFNRQELVMVLADRGTVGIVEHSASESVSMLDLAPAGSTLQGGVATCQVDEFGDMPGGIINPAIEQSIAGGPFVKVADMINATSNAIGQVPFNANSRIRVQAGCDSPLRARITG